MVHSLHRALKLSELFRCCHMDGALFSMRRYAENQIIDDTLDGSAAVGLVVSGQVDTYHVTMDGREIHLRSLGAGECFGLHDLLVEADAQAVIYCTKDAAIGYILKADLLRMMETDQNLTLQYAKLCNAELQFLLRRIEYLTGQSCRDRLVSYLLSQRGPDGRIALSCSREELARHLDMSRATLFRELAALQRQGLVKNEKGLLWIPDACALEQPSKPSSDRGCSHGPIR